jgi:4,5-DOPA dioxygenase extradiol
MQKQPILFIGHGSPMNAIENNVFTQSWSDIGKSLEKPRAILMLSAHWITEGETRISSARDPQMIYDMYGFPPELYRFRYTAPGSPEIAEEIVSAIASAHFCHTDEGSICSENDMLPEQISRASK